MSHLSIVSEDALQGQIENILPPVIVDRDDEYEVEYIKDFRIFHHQLQYMVKWMDYDERSWEPAVNVVKLKAIDEFYTEQSDFRFYCYTYTKSHDVEPFILLVLHVQSTRSATQRSNYATWKSALEMPVPDQLSTPTMIGKDHANLINLVEKITSANNAYLKEKIPLLHL
ncbi:hypothetical protein BDD12DRAFT_903080 [Trichophaea hybrida]|nr:hypothetical protein BDD12DRAFT_903080 [Trichophaea hybrida]